MAFDIRQPQLLYKLYEDKQRNY
ncbi:MAG: hypothetical protein JWN56_1224, partial [Sphingobacteriales bacterium]|nr:hypothetical protein [Sphingobacteriales bacterium]